MCVCHLEHHSCKNKALLSQALLNLEMALAEFKRRIQIREIFLLALESLDGLPRFDALPLGPSKMATLLLHS